MSDPALQRLLLIVGGGILWLLVALPLGKLCNGKWLFGISEQDAPVRYWITFLLTLPGLSAGLALFASWWILPLLAGLAAVTHNHWQHLWFAYVPVMVLAWLAWIGLHWWGAGWLVTRREKTH
jgi:hypothetical protein